MAISQKTTKQVAVVEIISEFCAQYNSTYEVVLLTVDFIPLFHRLAQIDGSESYKAFMNMLVEFLRESEIERIRNLKE